MNAYRFFVSLVCFSGVFGGGLAHAEETPLNLEFNARAFLAKASLVPQAPVEERAELDFKAASEAIAQCPSIEVEAFGASYHRDAPPGKFHERNYGPGVKIFATKKFLKGCWFVEIATIHPNSLGGRANNLGGGVDFIVLGDKKAGIDACLLMFYTNYGIKSPKPRPTVNHWIPAPCVHVRFGGPTLRVTGLGRATIANLGWEFTWW